MKLGDKIYNYWCIIGFVLSILAIKPILLSRLAWALIGLMVCNNGLEQVKTTGQSGETLAKIGRVICILFLIFSLIGTVLTLLGVGLGIALLA